MVPPSTRPLLSSDFAFGALASNQANLLPEK